MDRMLKSGMKTKWFAFMRADCLVRDEKNGILEKLVRAGLSHILIGVERAEDDTLSMLDKRFYTGGIAREAIEIFRTKYPEVFIQATFIVGVKEESPESLEKQLEMAKSLDVASRPSIRSAVQVRRSLTMRSAMGTSRKTTSMNSTG